MRYGQSFGQLLSKPLKGRTRRVQILLVLDPSEENQEFADALRLQSEMVIHSVSPLAPHCELIEIHSRAEAELGRSAIRTLVEHHPADAVVLYISGHGVNAPSGRHTLLPNQNDAVEHGVDCAALFEPLLASDIEHVFVIVDSCDAGALDSQWAQMARDLPQNRRTMPTLAILAAGDFTDKILIGSLAQLLQLVHDRLRRSSGFVGEFLSFADYATELSAVAKRNHGLPTPLWIWPRAWDAEEHSLCLPNPNYKKPRTLVSSNVAAVALRVEDLEYWIMRASGRADFKDAGWYFSGRSELVRPLAEFLRSGTGVLIVTGTAGSGKSALLGVLVTFADEKFSSNAEFAEALDALAPELRPPVGSIDAAILARNKPTDDIAAEILACLGRKDLVSLLPGRSVETLLRHVERAAKQVTIVIDGIDEARDPARLITELIVQLTLLQLSHHTPAVRLILGIRSPKVFESETDKTHSKILLTYLQRAIQNTAAKVLRTDDPGVNEDILLYIEALAGSAPVSRGWTLSKKTNFLERIANAVSPSFLDARLAGAQLRDVGWPMAHMVEDFISAIGGGTIALLRNDVEDVAQRENVDSSTIWTLFGSIAFALGNGLPLSDIWHDTAELLATTIGDPSSKSVADPEIILRSRLIGYVSVDEQDGREVYRLNHERLAEAVRTLVRQAWSIDGSRPDDAAIYEILYRALLRNVPSDDVTPLTPTFADILSPT